MNRNETSDNVYTFSSIGAGFELSAVSLASLVVCTVYYFPLVYFNLMNARLKTG